MARRRRASPRHPHRLPGPHRLIAALAIICAAQVIVAAIAACVCPAAGLAHGPEGIPAWVLLAVSLAVTAFGAACWSGNLTMRILSLYWLALGASAAVPLLASCGAPYVATWPISAALVPVLLREGLRERVAACRAMLWSALVLPAVFVIDLALGDAPAPPTDALLLAAVLAIGSRTAAAAHRIGA